MSRQSSIQLQARIKRQKALEAHIMGKTWDECARIAGYASPGAAHQAVSVMLESVEVKTVENWRVIETQRLAILDSIAWDVLNTNHIHVTATGRVVKDTDAEGNEYVVTDHMPVLKALGEIRKNAESRRKLLGVDEPTRTKHEFEEHDTVDADIEKLVADMAGTAGLTAEEAGSIG